MSVRLVLADDHRIFREALRQLLEDKVNADVVGEADNGFDVVELVVRERPELVIMDVNMPSLNGIEATRRIMSALDGVKVVCLSMHADERFVKEMFNAGAKGYLLKGCTSEELVEAVRLVITGQEYISAAVRNAPVDGTRGDDGIDSAFATLTPREREVLQLYAEGATTKEIGHCLNVSEKTVGTHRVHIMDKLSLRSVADMTKYAVRQGITSL